MSAHTDPSEDIGKDACEGRNDNARTHSSTRTQTTFGALVRKRTRALTVTQIRARAEVERGGSGVGWRWERVARSGHSHAGTDARTQTLTNMTSRAHNSPNTRPQARRHMLSSFHDCPYRTTYIHSMVAGIGGSPLHPQLQTCVCKLAETDIVAKDTG